MDINGDDDFHKLNDFLDNFIFECLLEKKNFLDRFLVSCTCYVKYFTNFQSSKDKFQCGIILIKKKGNKPVFINSWYKMYISFNEECNLLIFDFFGEKYNLTDNCTFIMQYCSIVSTVFKICTNSVFFQDVG